MTNLKSKQNLTNSTIRTAGSYQRAAVTFFSAAYLFSGQFTPGHLYRS
jgi:hypothetical protein